MDVHLFPYQLCWSLWEKMTSQGRGFPHFLFFLIIFSVLYLWLCWVFVCHERAFCSFSERGLLSSFGVRASLVDSRSRPLGYSSWSTRASVAPLRSCGIFPDRGSNPCALLRQVGSYPLRQQGRWHHGVEGSVVFSRVTLSTQYKVESYHRS